MSNSGRIAKTRKQAIDLAEEMVTICIKRKPSGVHVMTAALRLAAELITVSKHENRLIDSEVHLAKYEEEKRSRESRESTSTRPVSRQGDLR